MLSKINTYIVLIFDIKHFYPSVNENLSTKALTFAESCTDISDKDKHIINHSRKFLPFNNKQALIKKEKELLDVTMGAYIGAEVCELVGSYLIYQLSIKYKRHQLISR